MICDQLLNLDGYMGRIKPKAQLFTERYLIQLSSNSETEEIQAQASRLKSFIFNTLMISYRFDEETRIAILETSLPVFSGNFLDPLKKLHRKIPADDFTRHFNAIIKKTILNAYDETVILKYIHKTMLNYCKYFTVFGSHLDNCAVAGSEKLLVKRQGEHIGTYLKMDEDLHQKCLDNAQQIKKELQNSYILYHGAELANNFLKSLLLFSAFPFLFDYVFNREKGYLEEWYETGELNPLYFFPLAILALVMLQMVTTSYFLKKVIAKEQLTLEKTTKDFEENFSFKFIPPPEHKQDKQSLLEPGEDKEIPYIAFNYHLAETIEVTPKASKVKTRPWFSMRMNGTEHSAHPKEVHTLTVDGMDFVEIISKNTKMKQMVYFDRKALEGKLTIRDMRKFEQFFQLPREISSGQRGANGLRKRFKNREDEHYYFNAKLMSTEQPVRVHCREFSNHRGIRLFIADEVKTKKEEQRANLGHA